MPRTSRLCWHALLGLVLFGSFVLSPLLLLLRAQLGVFAGVLGIILLAVGSASLLGAVLTRCIDYHSCTRLQWRFIVLAAWILNPVSVVCFAVRTDYKEVACWSALPFGAVLALASCRLRLLEGDPDWSQEGCPPRPTTIVTWLFSRTACVAVPMCVLSFQVTLYLPESKLLPQGPEVGLFVCGGCVLISAKFCAMCAALARQRLPQAFMLVLLLSADWISSLHLLELVRDDMKTFLLLLHLQLVGLIQMKVTLGRLRLWSRWVRASSHRRAAEEDPSARLEAGLQVGLQAGTSANNESSDSDDENGPGSLPDGFHDSLLGVLGIPSAREPHQRRQFLMGARRALVMGEASGDSVPSGVSMEQFSVRAGVEQAAAGASVSIPSSVDTSTATGGDAATVVVPAEGSQEASPTSTPLEITETDKLCTVCLDEIRTGDKVRPLPKCSHVFHAACLERWARTMRESTRCPTCRRPALAKKAAEGTVSISVLASGEEGGPQSAAGSSRPGSRTSSMTSADGGGSEASSELRGEAPPPRRGPRTASSARPARPALRNAPLQTHLVAQLHSSLGISEALARAALEFSGRNPETAAGVVLEHAAVLEALSRTEERLEGSVPRGVAEALIAANPHLAEYEGALRMQLDQIRRMGRLGPRAWHHLSQAGRAEVFRVVLQDVARRLEEAAPAT